VAAARDAVADAQLAEVAAAEAEASREAAEADVKLAGARAAEAEVSREAAEAAAKLAGARAAEAEASAQVAAEAVEQFTAAIPAAEQVSKELYDSHFRQWLLERFGAERYEYFRDNELNRIVIHTDRFTEVESAMLRDLIGNAVPQGVEIVQYNHHIAISWRDFNELNGSLAALLGADNFALASPIGRDAIVLQTDHVEGEQLEQVNGLIERANPQNVDVVRYNHGMEISWQDAENKYAACQTVYDMLEVNPDYGKDLTSRGEWVYHLPEMTDIGHFDNNMYNALFVQNNAIVSCSLSLPKNTDTTSAFRMCKNLKYLTLYTPECTDSKAMLFDSPALVELDLFAPKSTSRGNGLYNIALNSLRKMRVVLKEATWVGRNVPVLEELHIEAASICTVGTQGFPLSILNSESAVQVMNSLAVTRIDGTGVNFTLGIHVDHQNNEAVHAAKAAAEAHGWVMVIQWNGTPTAEASVTYGLRTPPIFARVGEIELPDGTVERVLDWGHYVTDPSGYEEFRSVEAAREYFGLPDESLTETE
jgi:hypothetical protein